MFLAEGSKKMEDEWEQELDDRKGRYLDFSEDNDLLHRFSPDGGFGSYLSMHAELISHYLGYRNPTNKIAGLLAHHSALSAGMHRTLKKIVWLTFINTAFVGYIVFKAF
jgi:hypothetical protein